MLSIQIEPIAVTASSRAVSGLSGRRIPRVRWSADGRQWPLQAMASAGVHNRTITTALQIAVAMSLLESCPAKSGHARLANTNSSSLTSADIPLHTCMLLLVQSSGCCRLTP